MARIADDIGRWRRMGPWRVLAGVAVLAATIALTAGWSTVVGAVLTVLPEAGEIRPAIARFLVVLALGFLVVGALEYWFWRPAALKRPDHPPPRILITIVAGVIYLVAIGIGGAAFLGLNVLSLVTASSVVLAIIGFALRGMIADLFYGIALTVERPYEVGDWICIGAERPGQVREVNWRATTIVTREEITLVIPNSEIATKTFRNFDRPEPWFRSTFRIVLDFGLPPARAERLLLAAVKQVPESAGVPRPPEIRLAGFTQHGVEWEVRFWSPSYIRLAPVERAVKDAVLKGLHYAGVRIPRERSEVFIGRLHEERSAEKFRATEWSRRIDLFSVLNEAELHEVVERAQRRMVKQGQPLIRQGEPGASLFIVQEGVFSVAVTGKDGAEQQVATLEPGAVFGEMSLLTGEPRSATVIPLVDGVVHEVRKEDLGDLIAEHPELATHMSRTLAERKMATEASLARMTAQQRADAESTMAADILTRIRRFFGGNG